MKLEHAFKGGGFHLAFIAEIYPISMPIRSSVEKQTHSPI